MLILSTSWKLSPLQFAMKLYESDCQIFLILKECWLQRQKIRFKGLWKQFITWFCLVISFPFQIVFTFLQVRSRKGKLLKIWLKATIQIFLIFKCLSVQNCSWLNTFCPTVLLVQIIKAEHSLHTWSSDLVSCITEVDVIIEHQAINLGSLTRVISGKSRQFGPTLCYFYKIKLAALDWNSITIPVSCI